MLSSNLIRYLLKITTIILLMNLILLFIKEGSLKNTIKFVFSIIILIYSIYPVFSIKDCKDDMAFEEKSVVYQSDFLSEQALKKQEKVIKIISDCLTKNDIAYKNISVSISTQDMLVENVKIILDKQLINEKSEHILYTEEIKMVIANLLNVVKEKILVEYE